MRDVFSSLGLVHTRQFFLHRPMVLFDFDGTLAPLSRNRDQVQLKPLTRALLSRLSQILPVGVVSGRQLSDLQKKLQGIEGLFLVGNHGAECAAEGESAPREQIERAAFEVEAFLKALDSSAILRDLPPSVLENKRLSLTFHWRALDSLTAQRASHEARSLALQWGSFRMIPGTESLSLVPRGLNDKGDAALGLLESSGSTHLVYLGDEDTDEDVFIKARNERFMGIRVGERTLSSAEWFLSEQSEVDRLLEVFLALVAGPTAAMTFMARSTA